MPTAGPDLRVTAALQATAIVQQAEATALILQAQNQARALVSSPSPSAPGPAPATLQPGATRQTTPAETPTAAGSAAPAATDEGKIEITRVGFAADGAYIIVQFKAPPRLTHSWMQGSVALIDEASGAVYNEIPVAPVIGPLIGRPKQPGQLGYVMLVNAPRPLADGALVTVVLGDYRQEHLKVH